MAWWKPPFFQLSMLKTERHADIIKKHHQICCPKMQDHNLPAIIPGSNLSDMDSILWNALVDELNFDTNSLSYFKLVILKYHHKSLAVNYDCENPRTFKTICLKCNSVRSATKKCNRYVCLFV